MPFREGLGQGQSKPGTFVLRQPRVHDLKERLHDPWDVVFGDADPIVANGKSDRIVATAIHMDFHASAPVAKLYGVGYQVDQNLLYPQRVGTD